MTDTTKTPHERAAEEAAMFKDIAALLAKYGVETVLEAIADGADGAGDYAGGSCGVAHHDVGKALHAAAVRAADAKAVSVSAGEEYIGIAAMLIVMADSGIHDRGDP